MRTLLPALLLLIAGAQAPNELVVRIGLSQNASTVTLRSDKAFTVQQTRTRTAKFTMILSVDADAANRALSHADLRYRTLVELDGGRLLVLPTTTKVRIEPAGALIDIDNRRYRGSIAVFGNSRNMFTVVNELPLEDYLLGVVPNELSPTTFGELEALSAGGALHPAKPGAVQERRV
jgi:stage II sporulation protein D